MSQRVLIVPRASVHEVKAEPGNHARNGLSRVVRVAPDPLSKGTSGSGVGGGAAAADKRAFLRSDAAFQRQYYWLWAADKVLDIAVGSPDSHTCARVFRCLLYALGTLSFATGAVSNLHDLLSLRASRAAGEAEAGDTLVEGIVLTFAGACVWYAAVTALLCWWSLQPRRRPMRLRDALRTLPYLPPPARMAFVHGVAKAMLVVATMWQLGAMVTVAMSYGVGFTDGVQERVTRAFTALPVHNIGHAWAGVDVVVWLLCDLPCIWSPLASALLCLLAREHVAEFERRRLVEDLATHATAASALPLLRDRCVAEVIHVITAFNRRMGGAGHVTLLGSGVAAVFTVVMIGLGGPPQIAVMGVIGPVPVCAAFLFLFASVNARVALLRRTVGTLRVAPFLGGGGGGRAAAGGGGGGVEVVGDTPTAAAGLGVALSSPASPQDGASLRGKRDAGVGGGIATSVGSTTMVSRGARGEAHASASGEGPHAVVLDATSSSSSVARDVVVLEAALVNVESLLLSSTGFVGVSVFATGPQVFTYQLAESFVGALASLLVLVGTRG